MTVYDIATDELIKKAAEELKKLDVMMAPEWSKFVKTSAARERPPVNKEWWYVRSASMLRKLYVFDSPMGVSKLRKRYGGKKNRGHKPERVYKGSGKIIRTIFQQLERAGFIKQVDKKGRKGRILTAKGKSFLDKLRK